MKLWTGSDKTSIKKDELYKVLKPMLGLSMSLSKSQFGNNKSEMKEAPGESTLKKLLERLLEK